MQHLSALDALFLYLETPETPMHVGSLFLLEKPKGHRGSFYPNIRRLVESRMHLAPLFSRKLAFMPFDLANPIWVQDDRVDIDWHIRSMTLPKPGSVAQLEAAVAKLHEGMLDRDRPLWQFTIIEGLASGEVAFTSRIHHAGLDGQGGVALAQAVLDIEPKAAPRAQKSNTTETKRNAMPPSAAKMLSAAFRNSVAQYGKILKASGGAVKSLAAGAMALTSSQAKKMGAPTEQLSGLANMAELAGNIAKLKTSDTPLQAAKKLLPAGMKLGPRTPLNVAITGKRSFATAQIPLSEAKALAKHFDVKVNDIILATVSGALRRFYADDKVILSKSMIGAVPASLRTPGDTSQSNQVTMMLINMATNIADPAKRMVAIRDASGKAKSLTGSMKGAMTAVTSDLPTLGIPWLMGIITPLYKTAVGTNRIPVVANLVISNVPGPPIPLYMAGAKLKSYYPVSIVTHGLALNITIHSYAGSLDYGFIAAKEQVPKLAHLVKCLLAAHQELVAVAINAAAETGVAAASVAPKPVARKKPTTKKPMTKKPPSIVAKRKARSNNVNHKQMPSEDDSPFDFLKKFRNANHKPETTKNKKDAMPKSAAINDFAEQLRAPGATLIALEARAPWELGATLAAWPLLRTAPAGDGHAVIVFPGLGAGDFSTAPLRSFLSSQGYETHGWDLGFNFGPRDGVLKKSVERVMDIYGSSKRKVSLIGWSLGGLYAREFAKALPKQTRSVITLGTPFSGDPKATNAWRFYEFVSGHKLDDKKMLAHIKEAPPVPTTSIFSRTDGVVAWPLSIQAESKTAENIEVIASHVGMGMNPIALYAVADRLAQAEGSWKKFDRSGWRQYFYRDPNRAE